MGIGDNIMATGLARGAAARGKRIAFGDGRRIIWDKNSPEIFRKNKNIAIPGSENDKDVEWIPFHRGNRLYNKQGVGRWLWNREFRPIPGELFFDDSEMAFANGVKPGFILIEPNVPWHKTVAPNKDWGREKYQALATRLLNEGFDVAQFGFGRVRLTGARVIQAVTFRQAAAVLARASAAIVPEGGLHHAAAAVGVRAVVLFGGFIPPTVTGYDTHINLAGSDQFCGSLGRCSHCFKAMQSISVDTVVNSLKEIVRG